MSLGTIQSTVLKTNYLDGGRLRECWLELEGAVVTGSIELEGYFIQYKGVERSPCNAHPWQP
ncbi:hypothetical protein TWF730_009145 [Orbilia blumenaviensis]|uniref:Uncharacterized protein n=1 Tax=Orbilia blumenaviensis TaxID=1796055 RepID=A0AAV9UZS3_9PEZI